MQAFKTGNATVDQMGKTRITGNMVPQTWFQWVRYTNKRGNYPDPLAILILADIVYWYRPSEVRDEDTGHTIGWKKKFTYEMLQRSPDYYSELYGISPKQARESLKLLETLGLIEIKRKPLKTKFGVLPTSMFVSPVVSEISKITHTLNPSFNANSSLTNSEGSKTEVAPETPAKSLFTNWGGLETLEKCFLLSSNEATDELGNLSYMLRFTETSFLNQPEKKEKNQPPQNSDEPQPEASDTLSQDSQANNQSSSDNQKSSVDQYSEALPKNSTAPTPTQTRYDSGLCMRPIGDYRTPTQRANAWIPDGPWKNEAGFLDRAFQEAIAKKWVEEFGGDLERKKCDVVKHLKKDPDNIAIEWEWYRATTFHAVANVATRKAMGCDTTQDEQKLAKHSRVALAVPEEMRVSDDELELPDYAASVLCLERPVSISAQKTKPVRIALMENLEDKLPVTAPIQLEAPSDSVEAPQDVSGANPHSGTQITIEARVSPSSEVSSDDPEPKQADLSLEERKRNMAEIRRIVLQLKQRQQNPNAPVDVPAPKPAQVTPEERAKADAELQKRKAEAKAFLEAMQAKTQSEVQDDVLALTDEEAMFDSRCAENRHLLAQMIRGGSANFAPQPPIEVESLPPLEKEQYLRQKEEELYAAKSRQQTLQSPQEIATQLLNNPATHNQGQEYALRQGFDVQYDEQNRVYEVIELDF